MTETIGSVLQRKLEQFDETTRQALCEIFHTDWTIEYLRTLLGPDNRLWRDVEFPLIFVYPSPEEHPKLFLVTKGVAAVLRNKLAGTTSVAAIITTTTGDRKRKQETQQETEQRKKCRSDQRTLENRLVRLLVGKGKYRDVQNFKEMLERQEENNTYIFQHMRHDRPVCYEKDGQLKSFVAFSQLCALGMRCCVCDRPIQLSDNVVLSHNFGHQMNRWHNEAVHRLVDVSVFPAGVAESMGHVFQHHYLYSLIHTACNETHYHEHQDAYELMKPKLDHIKLPQTQVTRPSHKDLYYWFEPCYNQVLSGLLRDYPLVYAHIVAHQKQSVPPHIYEYKRRHASL
jgi:hypothetical protein